MMSMSPSVRSSPTSDSASAALYHVLAHRAGEVAEDVGRAGRTEHVRGERIELRADEHRHVAHQDRAPQVGRELRDDLALLAERGARVAADGGRGGGSL